MAHASGRAQAAIVRDALAVYMQRRPRSIGMGDSGSGRFSEKAHELLDGMGEDGSLR